MAGSAIYGNVKYAIKGAQAAGNNSRLANSFNSAGNVPASNQNNFKWGNPASTPTYGHAFTKHGSKVKSQQLIDRARALDHQVGRWLDDKKAADFLAEIAKKGPGVHEVPLPQGFPAESFLGNGTKLIPDKARVIVRSDGSIKTAYPFDSSAAN